MLSLVRSERKSAQRKSTAAVWLTGFAHSALGRALHKAVVSIVSARSVSEAESSDGLSQLWQNLHTGTTVRPDEEQTPDGATSGQNSDPDSSDSSDIEVLEALRPTTVAKAPTPSDSDDDIIFID